MVYGIWWSLCCVVDLFSQRLDNSFPHQQCVWVALCPHPLQHLLLFVFLMTTMPNIGWSKCLQRLLCPSGGRQFLAEIHWLNLWITSASLPPAPLFWFLPTLVLSESNCSLVDVTSACCHASLRVRHGLSRFQVVLDICSSGVFDISIMSLSMCHWQNTTRLTGKYTTYISSLFLSTQLFNMK